jgi:hypothetical protein
LCIVADDGGVDEEGEEGELVGGVVVLEQCGGVIVALDEVGCGTTIMGEWGTYHMEVFDGLCARSGEMREERMRADVNNIVEEHELTQKERLKSRCLYSSHTGGRLTRTWNI